MSEQDEALQLHLAMRTLEVLNTGAAQRLMKRAEAMIQRQHAEIERLTAERDAARDEFRALQAKHRGETGAEFSIYRKIMEECRPYMKPGERVVECIERERADSAALMRLYESVMRERDALKMQAQVHAQEARTANSTINEIYQAISGATGEPGNWHGAEPVREAFAKLRQERDALREALVESRRIVADALKAFGPCDHKVGICNCDMKRSIKQSDAVLAQIKEQP